MLWERVSNAVLIPAAFIAILWVIKIVETMTGISFSWLGIIPRDPSHLSMILTASLVHGSFEHLKYNTPPLFILGFAVIYFDPTASKKAIPIMYVLTGLILWVIGRESVHLGSSLVIYGLASFLFFSGIVRRDIRSVGLSLLLVFFYCGTLVMGLIPLENGVSWEGHLSGGIAGLITAILFRHLDPPKKYSWEIDDDDDDPEDTKDYYRNNFFN